MSEKIVLSEGERWAAMMTNDRQFDGAFVVAVKTTKIYCRPSCTARPPRRENVAFYDSPSEAEAAGFRACKRCSPNTQAYEASIVEQVCRYIDAHLDDRITLEALGAEVNLNPHHVQRMFKRVLSISPRQYAEARRLEGLKTRLKAGDSVTDALYESGFRSSSQLYGREHMGMTPGTFRKGAAITIRYAVAECALGYVAVAATERGVCAVRLGNTPDDLVAILYADFPAADLQPDDEGLGAWVEMLLCYLAGEEPHLELPLDIRATAFQQRVWEALRDIPYGETRSYTQIAEAIGNPKAVRAVANACANNPVAVVIPCHRVVREDGSLGGYKWGLERKIALLKTEAESAALAQEAV